MQIMIGVGLILSAQNKSYSLC